MMKYFFISLQHNSKSRREKRYSQLRAVSAEEPSGALITWIIAGGWIENAMHDWLPHN